MRLYELFSGMAALSWYTKGMTPPVFYKGGKRWYAKQISDTMGIPDDPEIVLVEADPFVADALRVVWTPELRVGAAALIRTWMEPEDEARARWNRYRQEALHGEWASLSLVERGSRWLWMRPRTVPMTQPPLLKGASGWLKSENHGTRNWQPHTPAHRLEMIPAHVSAAVICAEASTITPESGSFVYLDPPYDNTSGYGVSGSGYQEAAKIASLWACAGAVAAVSSAVALSDASIALQGRGNSRARHGTPEYLTIYRGGQSGQEQEGSVLQDSAV